jgi:hypothetical protein
VGLERGLLSLASTIEELLGRKSSGPGLESREYSRHANHVAPSNPQKLALTSPTRGDLSVGIIRSQTQATEFSLDYEERRLQVCSALFGACLLIVCNLSYSSTLKMDAVCYSEMSVNC